MDLYIDDDAFSSARQKMENCQNNLSQLQTNIVNAFEQLRIDWDSDAGKQFFIKFENDLIKNLNQYVKVFEYMGKNLSTASDKYDEVFSAANAVADAQY